MSKFKAIISFELALLIFSACTTPRSVLNSGKVVPKNTIRGGINYTFNIATSPVAESAKAIYNFADTYKNKDTVYLNNTVEDANKALLSYCLDPITFTNEYYLRAGLGHRMDMGYRNSGDAHGVDMMYQFLGGTGTFKDSEYNGMYGSVGFQYAHQSFKFMNNKIFNKFERFFGISMNRNDFTIPVIFSKSWGPEERTGCFSFGATYTHSFIKYKIAPKAIYRLSENDPSIPPELLQPIEGKMDYSSYGTFVNFKVGKRYVFFNLSVSAYYQNFGKYPILGGKTVALEGFSIVPSYGVQFNIPTKKKKKPVE
ncbi:MAG TPA: hypothetical protein VN026_16050 [Bacteroidia bacterium]|jgi:hypothetical protein|nr:hypothetical protein [Bacteroidia bacterium]